MNTIIEYIIIILFHLFFYFFPDKHLKNLNDPKCCHYLHNSFFTLHDSFNAHSHILLPFCFIFIIVLFIAKDTTNPFKLLLPLFVSNITVHLFKLFINKPRPDILQRINHYYSKLNLDNNVNINDKINILKNSKYQYELLDGYKSFISGHASSVFSMLFIIGYILYSNKDKINNLNYYLLLVIFIAYFMFAILCSESRLSDNKHHHIDIIAGILNGIIVSFYCFGLIHI